MNRSGIKNYITQVVPDNKANLEKASLDVAKIWSSVGVPYDMQGSQQRIKKNQSYYSGGGDRASETTEDVQVALKKLRDGYKSVGSDDNGSNKENKGLKIVFISILSLAVVGLGIFAYFKLIKAK